MIIYETPSLDPKPELPENKKLLSTIGGRGYRCFLIDQKTDEFNFMNTNENLLDEVLKPIYRDNYFLVRQSKDYPVPGFYTIQPLLKKKSTTELSEGELTLLSYLQQNIRIGLKQRLGIELFGLYTEERKDERFISHLIPYHINKFKENNFSATVYQPHIAEYLQSYNFPAVRSQMRIFNNKMKFMFEGQEIQSDIKMIKDRFGLKEQTAINYTAIMRGKNSAEI